ncbi:MAG TPA: hypothetical protein VE546_02115 [Streptomyces sp.]|uniref:hypothetical protein n=1 Tax=Streptomyces sp. TaxID=1931 RepID=UPI002D538E58|nr:hypothetical protein [Streptomyces sp.]HZG02367.1 hypothetical protein [Streptomyces sp.]
MTVRPTPPGCSMEKEAVLPGRDRRWRPTAVGRRCRRAVRGSARWAVRRRGIMADQFLRGACYGAGATAVSLLTLWAQTR